jgi:hypothetical protein
MTDEGLGEAAEKMIWSSAFANNNPRSDYHWQVDMIYAEAKRREKPEIYSDAYNKVSGGLS